MSMMSDLEKFESEMNKLNIKVEMEDAYNTLKERGMGDKDILSAFKQINNLLKPLKKKDMILASVYASLVTILFLSISFLIIALGVWMLAS